MLIDINCVEIIEGNLNDPRHQTGLIELLKAYFNDPMGGVPALGPAMEKELVSGLKNHPGALLFFAQYQNKLIGLAICFLGFSTFLAKKLLNLHDLIVLAEYRRQGVAGKLLLNLENKAKLLNCAKLTLEVRTDNHPAIKLYTEAGLSPGEHPMFFLTKILCEQRKKS